MAEGEGLGEPGHERRAIRLVQAIVERGGDGVEAAGVRRACSSSAVRCTLKTASARDSVDGSTPRAFDGGQADARRGDHDADARRPRAGARW